MPYPFYTSISAKIYNNILSVGQGNNNTSRNRSFDASKLVSFIRLISGTGDGLIIESNPNISVTAQSIYDSQTKQWMHNPSSYGNRFMSGMIGYDWSGKPVYSELNSQSTRSEEQVLRPSPIITGLEVKEGKDQISRQATLTIKCFSLSQCETIQKYCMEPGHSLLIEYGWNTPEAEAQMIELGNADDIVADTAAFNLNQNALHNKRVLSRGDYDSYFGFIVGGNTASDGDTFNVTVKLRGMPGMPTFLQSQQTINKQDEDIKDSTGKVVGKGIVTYAATPGYTTSDLEAGTGISGLSTALQPIAIGLRRYKWMYNSLPPQRQTPEVRKLVDKVKQKDSFYGWWDLINFDLPVSNAIHEYTTDSVINQFKSTFGLLKEVKVGSVTVPREKLISDERYINFGLVLAILNSNNGLKGYKIGNKLVKATVETTGYIGAFPGIFSTKKSKLLIPGKLPNFYNYFLNSALVDYNEIIDPTTFVDNSIYYTRAGKLYPLSFVQQQPLPLRDANGNIPKGYVGFHEDAGHYGRLDFLYINFEVFKNAMKNSSNKSLKDVLMIMLNEMSAAVNSYWNFQLIESIDENGDVEIRIIDENWTGKCLLNNDNVKPGTPAPIKEFVHYGEQSIFLDASLDVSVPSEMTNMIILKRQDYVCNPDGHPLSMGGIFSKEADKFFTGIDYKSSVAKPVKKSKTGTVTSDPYGFGATELRDLIAFKDKWTKTLKLKPKSLKEQLKESIAFMRIDEYIDANGVSVYKRIYSSASAAASGGAVPATINEEASNTAEGRKWDNLIKNIDEKTLQAEKFAETNLNANLQKIDIVPNPQQATVVPSTINITDSSISSSDAKKRFDENYKIYCCDDVQLFDILKNNAYENNNDLSKTSPLLPIQYTFKILGKSGLRRGDIFNIIGIPDKYRRNGFFQVIEIDQVLENNTWTTTVTGGYRQVG